MSNIYVTEPPYSGKVVLETSKGEIEIELFAKECPVTCKNFIALALEGYYDNMIWHRVVPDFIIQTGDPTGSGLGGESFYGQSFTDEFHQRLRFNRRGLLGMANASTPNSNDSQFFLTLASTPELQARHTMFGRISSNTIYNMVNMAESAGEIGDDDRPMFPPKLKTIRVIENPFEGEIELRITREEREEMKRNKREAAKRNREREEAGVSDRKKKKNTALLSFGQEEEIDEGEVFRGSKSSHDLLKNDKRLKKESAIRSVPEAPEERQPPLQRKEDKDTRGRKDSSQLKEADTHVDNLRERVSSKVKNTSSAEKIAELEAALRGSSKHHGDEVATVKRAGRGRDLLQEYRDKYKQAANQSKTSLKKKDEETAALLSSFQKRLRSEAEEVERKRRKEADGGIEDVPEEMREYGASDGDEDDAGWRNHKFDFGGKAVANDGHENDEYVTLDPRDTTSSKAALLGFGGSEGAKRAKEDRAKEGRRGRDWVDPRDQGNHDRDRRSRDNRQQGDHRRHEDNDRYERSRQTRPPPVGETKPRDIERW